MDTIAIEKRNAQEARYPPPLSIIDLNCYRGAQSKNVSRIGKDIAIIDEIDTFLRGVFGMESFDRKNRVNIYF